MRHLSSIVATAVTALVAFSVTACGGDGGDTAQSPDASPVPVAVSPQSPKPSASPQSFPSPTVKGQPPSRGGILPPDLISSTNPDQRLQQIKSNRSDPFALLPSTVPIVQTPPQQAAGTAPEVPSLPQVPQITQVPRIGVNGQIGGPGGKPNGAGGQAGQTPKPLVPLAPPKPQPVLAKAVKVTGVVQVGSTLYAIVNAPNEPSSRYVQAGQRLSNGQVLVRRIELNGPEPVVVLEQYGVEVMTAVGQGGPPPQNGQPAA